MFKKIIYPILLKSFLMVFISVYAQSIAQGQDIDSSTGDKTAADLMKDAADEIEFYSLEELLNVKVGTASRKMTPIRESPAIMTVVTAEEIEKSGARDLIDVLRLVPGITFGLDTLGVTGIAVRGNWAHEGKALISVDGQMNAEKTGTSGGEIEFRYRDKWGYATANYSIAATNILGNDNLVEQYESRDGVSGEMKDEHILLGMPMHKATLNSSVSVWRGLSINPSFIFLSERWGLYKLDAAGDMYIKKYNNTYLFNLFFYYTDLGIKGLNAGIGMYNILDSKDDFIQPYRDGSHAPLPGPSRQLVVKLSYHYMF